MRSPSARPVDDRYYSSAGPRQYGRVLYRSDDEYPPTVRQPVVEVASQSPIPAASYVPAPGRKARGWLTSLVALAALVVGFGIGNLTAGGAPVTTPTGQPPVTVTVTSQPSPEDEGSGETDQASPTSEASEQPSGVGDGQWEVGVDIQPGTYTTVVPTTNDEDVSCYVAALASDETDVIDSSGGGPGEELTFTVPAEAAYFTSQDCGTWQPA